MFSEKLNYGTHVISLNCLLLLCGLIAGCETQPKATETKTDCPVKLFKVSESDNKDYRTYPAKIRSSQRVKLAFQVSGQITSFPPKAGNLVRKGEILGELDARDYENAYKSAKATYNESKTDYERYSRLVDKKAVSVAVFQAKRKAFEVAEATMKIAEKALADTKLIAPFDGVVASTYVDKFQNIQAKQEILSLQGTTDIELIINIPEKDVIKSPAAQTLSQFTEKTHPSAVFPALGDKTFPLQFRELEAEADSSTQAFKAILTMPAPQDFSIKPGMTAMVKIADNVDKKAATGYWIPARSVAEDNQGKPYVWLVDNQQTVHKREVAVDHMDNASVFVTSGLMPGDVIAVSGIHFLGEGMTVRELTHIGDRSLAGIERAGK